MEKVLQDEFSTEVNRVVDLIVQREAIGEQIKSLRKDICSEFDIKAPMLTKVVNIVRKENLSEETEIWEEILDFVKICI